MPDVVTRIIELVRERTQVDPVQLQRIEREARLLMAGERHRISERPRRIITIEQVDERLRRRMSVRKVAAELGVERSTIYRLLRRHRLRKVAAAPAVPDDA